MSAASQFTPARNIRHDYFGLAVRLDVAVIVRVSNDRICVSDIYIFWIWPQRIKSDAEWTLQICRINFIDLGLALIFALSKHTDEVCPAFSDKYISVRSSADESWVLKARGEFLHLKAFWNDRHCTFGTFD